MNTLGRLRKGAVVLAVSAVAAAPLAQPSAAVAAERGASPRVDTPIVVAHRGASGHRPEHTLAAYKLAIRMGADYIEPDLVSTKDGVLVARHENEISGTTDVADRPEFADRRTTKMIDGSAVTGWFTEDFTLAELKTLRAKERLPLVRPQNTRYDGRYQVPTFDEVLKLVKVESRRRGTTIGVYPETKHPTLLRRAGPVARGAARRCAAAPPPRPAERRGDHPVVRDQQPARPRPQMVRVPLAQLVSNSGAPYDLVAKGDGRTYRDLVTPAGLREIATYADGVGAHKDLVLPRDASGRTGEPSSLVRDAHAEGLLVHVWTMRNENQFMATNFRRGADPNAHGDAEGEIFAFLDAGVDGLFGDYPDTAVEARDAWLEERADRAA